MSLPTYSTDWHNLQQFAQIFPEHFGVVYTVAEGYYQEGNYEKALKFYKRALKINTKEDIDWGHIAYAFEEFEKDYLTASRYFKKAIDKLGKHDTWLFQRLAWCYVQDKQYKLAIDILLEHTHFNNTDAWAFGKLGYCHQMIEDFETALKYHLQSEQLSPHDAWNLSCVGYCYQKIPSPNYAMALEYHLRSEQFNSYDFWNIKNAGYCYQKTGNYQKALDYHLRVYDEDPSDAWNVKNVGYAYQQIGNHEKALKYHYLVEKMLPEDTWNLGNIGYCLQRCQKHKEAIPYHQKVYELDPYDSWNKYQLGYCYFTQYNLEAAEFYLQGDDDKYAVLHLGSVHLVKGETYKAMELYRDAYQLFGDLNSFLSVFNLDRRYLEADYEISANTCDYIDEEMRLYDQNYQYPPNEY